jgi:hypothetical protein
MIIEVESDVCVVSVVEGRLFHLVKYIQLFWVFLVYVLIQN